MSKTLPPELRLLIAAVALAAAGRPVTARAVISLAQVARSATYRERHELLNELVATIAPFVRATLHSTAQGKSAGELQQELEFAHQSIARERARVTELKAELEGVVGYAKALHDRLRVDLEVIRQEQQSKVRPLRIASFHDDEA